MSRDIIDYGPLLVNTFSGGKEFGECVQFTTVHTEGWDVPNTEPDEGYVSMTREDAILFLSDALNKLLKQVRDDKINPPWWQEMINCE